MRPSDRRAQEIAGKIAQATGRKIEINVVHSLRGDRKQAEAGTNGKTITLGRGLLETLDDDELAAVIAHEVAHFEIREKNEKQYDTEEKRPGIGESLEQMDQKLKNSGAGSGFRALAQIATLGIGLVGGHIIAKSNRREIEKEADKKAVEILYKLGFRSDAGVDALEKMDDRRNLRSSFLEEVLATHPVTNERAEEIRKTADSIKPETAEEECQGDCEDQEISCEDCSCPETCCDKCHETECWGYCEDPEMTCEDCGCPKSCCEKCCESNSDFNEEK